MAKENIWAVNGGIPMGFTAGKTEGEPPELDNEFRYTDDRMIVTTGSSGSGKTRRVLLASAAQLTDWSMLIVDPKSLLYRMTAKHRKNAGSQIVVLDPFGPDSDGFNPIQEIELDEEFPDNAMELAEAIIRVEGKDPHWSQAAQEVIAALIMYVRLVIPHGSFADVRTLLGRDDKGIRMLVRGGFDTDPRQLELWEKTPDDKKDPYYFPPVKHEGALYPGMIAAARMHKCPEIETKIARFGGITPDDREMHSVLSTALTQTRFLDSRPIKKDLSSRKRINFAEMKNRKITVYLNLPIRRLTTHSGWLRLITASIVQKLMIDASPGKVPVLLMMDEFAALAGGANALDSGDGFPAISRNVPLFREYGIKAWVVFQDFPQAVRIYQNGFESFLGNAGVLQSFAPQDVTTSEHLSKLTGQRTEIVPSASGSVSFSPSAPGISRTTGLSFSQTPMPLMLPQELRNMQPGYSVVFSHVLTGPRRVFFPWHRPGLEKVYALDPSA